MVVGFYCVQANLTNHDSVPPSLSFSYTRRSKIDLLIRKLFIFIWNHPFTSIKKILFPVSIFNLIYIWICAALSFRISKKIWFFNDIIIEYFRISEWKIRFWNSVHRTFQKLSDWHDLFPVPINNICSSEEHDSRL